MFIKPLLASKQSRIRICLLLMLFSFHAGACMPLDSNQTSIVESREPATALVQTTKSQSSIATPPSPIVLPESVVSSQARILGSDEIKIDFEIISSTDIQDDQGLVVMNSESLDVTTDELSLDYLTWDGARSPLMTIRYTGGDLPDGFSMNVGSVPLTSSSILVSISEFFHVREFYIVELSSGNIWGIDPGCPEPIFWDYDILLGPRYVAYRCKEAGGVWYLFSVENPSNILSFVLPITNGELISYRPRWVNENLLLLEGDFHHSFCLIEAPNWEPSCWEYPFWIGKLNLDDGLIEIRDSLYLDPDKVGVLPFDCLSLENCEPITRRRWFPEGKGYFIDDSSWIQNGPTLLLAIALETDGSNNETDETEFWLLDTDTMMVERVGHYDTLLVFNPVQPSARPELWSPDGEWIVVTEANNHYLLSIKTGELKPFAEGGYLLGPLELHSATSQ